MFKFAFHKMKESVVESMSHFETKRSLFKRVAAYGLNFGTPNLVLIFGKHVRWMNVPMEERVEEHAVEKLAVFLKALAFSQDEVRVGRFEALLCDTNFGALNDGQPRSVRGLNLSELYHTLEEGGGDSRIWMDASAPDGDDLYGPPAP